MEPKTSIKQHDFISGEPRNKYFIHWTAEQTTNPCSEIQLADWQETILRMGDGYQQGELGVVMAPSGLGKTGMMRRLMESMGDNRQITNFDYASLYPEVQRTYEIFTENEPCHIQEAINLLGLTNEEITENNLLQQWENEN